MKDRKMTKWLPFDSVTSSKNAVNKLEYERNKIEKPILSEDELNEIEENIIRAYQLKQTITIHYYENGYIKKITNKIHKIDTIKKRIIFCDHSFIYFNQVLDVGKSLNS